MDGSDFTFQVDLIHAVDQMDDYPTDSCAISPTAFLFSFYVTVMVRIIVEIVYTNICISERNNVN